MPETVTRLLDFVLQVWACRETCSYTPPRPPTPLPTRATPPTTPHTRRDAIDLGPTSEGPFALRPSASDSYRQRHAHQSSGRVTPRRNSFPCGGVAGGVPRQRAADPSTVINGDGTYLVGKDIQPGTYGSNNDSSGWCYWERLSGLSGELDDVIANQPTEPPFTDLQVPSGVAVDTTGTVYVADNSHGAVAGSDRVLIRLPRQ